MPITKIANEETPILAVFVPPLNDTARWECKQAERRTWKAQWLEKASTNRPQRQRSPLKYLLCREWLCQKRSRRSYTARWENTPLVWAESEQIEKTRWSCRRHPENIAAYELQWITTAKNPALVFVFLSLSWRDVTEQFTSQPLVPIGAIVTAYYLGSGIQSFYNRDPAKSQKMMRARVASQFATLLIFVGYAGSQSFTFNPRPHQYGDDEEEEKK